MLLLLLASSSSATWPAKDYSASPAKQTKLAQRGTFPPSLWGFCSSFFDLFRLFSPTSTFNFIFNNNQLHLHLQLHLSSSSAPIGRWTLAVLSPSRPLALLFASRPRHRCCCCCWGVLLGSFLLTSLALSFSGPPPSRRSGRLPFHLALLCFALLCALSRLPHHSSNSSKQPQTKKHREDRKLSCSSFRPSSLLPRLPLLIARPAASCVSPDLLPCSPALLRSSFHPSIHTLLSLSLSPLSQSCRSLADSLSLPLSFASPHLPVASGSAILITSLAVGFPFFFPFPFGHSCVWVIPCPLPRLCISLCFKSLTTVSVKTRPAKKGQKGKKNQQ